MRDKISLERAQKLHPQVRQEVIDIINQIEAAWQPAWAIRIVQGLRTIQEQNNLYAQGRTMPGKIVTNAKGGSSYHNYALAIDFALLHDKDGNGSYETLSWNVEDPGWHEVVKAFEAKGWYWGGNFSSIKDYPHLEKSFGFKPSELLKRYKEGQYVDLK